VRLTARRRSKPARSTEARPVSWSAAAVGAEGGGGEQDGPVLSERRHGEQREQERRQQERVELKGEVRDEDPDERPDRRAPAQQQPDPLSAMASV